MRILKNKIKRLKVRAVWRMNRFVNRKQLKRKIFCIGLHKTGTSSLAKLAKKYGFRAIHSTDWIFDPEKLREFNFFSDGGSQFDGINEFDYEFLFYEYPESLFILQSRDTRKWIISKLKHAGWNDKTIIESDDPRKIKDDDWTYKSLLTVGKFIEHKFNYEKKVNDFFVKNDPTRLLKIDITDQSIQSAELRKLADFMGVRTVKRIGMPHINKAKPGIELSADVLAFIDKKIEAINRIGN